MHKLQHYETADGRDPVQEWLDRLRDARVYAAILRRIDRMALGNFGDHAFCRDGVWELRIDSGPGYHVYYSFAQETIVILLCAGDKRRQQSDIGRAVDYLRRLRKEFK